MLVCIGFSANAQEVYSSSGKSLKAIQKKKKEKEKGFHWNKLVVSGSFGFGAGNGETYFGIAPLVGYRLTDKFAAGIGLGYQYTKINNYIALTDVNNVTKYYDYKANMISPSVWVRYNIMPWLVAQVQYEHNFINFTDYGFASNGSGAIEATKTHVTAPCLLLGVGYRRPVGEHSSFSIMLLYDAIQNQYSPYPNSIFPQIGFTIGL